jgi:nucleolar MIF4G domain-containing protein 1
LVIDGIASHSSLLDSYVVLYAAFVSSLHKILGVEFGRKGLSSGQHSRLICINIAAHFIQQVVSSYELYYAKAQSIQFARQRPNADEQLETDTVGKECLNLAVLFSELYNFQVISSILVFDIIRGLLEGDLTEFGVELLLKIVRSTFFHFNPSCYCVLIPVQDSGQQLRQDDPSALTDIIQIVQNKVMSNSGDLRYLSFISMVCVLLLNANYTQFPYSFHD